MQVNILFQLFDANSAGKFPRVFEKTFDEAISYREEQKTGKLKRLPLGRNFNQKGENIITIEWNILSFFLKLLR